VALLRPSTQVETLQQPPLQAWLALQAVEQEPMTQLWNCGQSPTSLALVQPQVGGVPSEQWKPWPLPEQSVQVVPSAPQTLFEPEVHVPLLQQPVLQGCELSQVDEQRWLAPHAWSAAQSLACVHCTQLPPKQPGKDPLHAAQVAPDDPHAGRAVPATHSAGF
jgi:hypothetical protein